MASYQLRLDPFHEPDLFEDFEDEQVVVLPRPRPTDWEIHDTPFELESLVESAAITEREVEIRRVDDLPTIDNPGGTEAIDDDWEAGVVPQPAHEQAQHCFGLPSGDGVYLVGIVEFSADSNEDGWTYADMMARAAILSAAKRLGWKEKDVEVNRRSSPLVGTLPNGLRLAAFQSTVEGTRPWFRATRAPNESERSGWTCRVVG